MDESKQKSFLGRGWAFPPTFDYVTKMPVMVTAEEDIRQSLIILLSTLKNERVMQPEYGSDLIKHIFDEMNNSLYHYLIDLIRNAILINEPRVDVDKIDLKMEVETIRIYINYTIRSTNSRHNLVYPFFIGEGTNIEAHERIYG